MSRSRRRTAYLGITGAPSEKRDKREWHRRMRAGERGALRHGRLLPLPREVSDPWAMAKDGKVFGQRWRDIDRLMRK
ncbi:MAG TPA: hypothetical protein VIA06_02625 [Candidatus Dormibacteraeota bacterium]|jgi:hypothetical protein|nr:hypothetical protein [Candidatus Dormibacteraeota bacterium]